MNMKASAEKPARGLMLKPTPAGQQVQSIRANPDGVRSILDRTRDAEPDSVTGDKRNDEK